MKLRTLFVSDRKQIHVPEGWVIDTVNVVTPNGRKPEYLVLLKKLDDKHGRIGFSVK